MSGLHTAYGTYEIGVDVRPGQVSELPYTTWLTPIDVQNAVHVPAYTNQAIVVTTPRIPGLELHIPAHSSIRDAYGRPVTEISITPLPNRLPPFPLPPGVLVPTYFTIQPGGAYIHNTDHRGARLIYPNITNLEPGTRTRFWHYDPEEKGWFIYGQGSVSPDRKHIVPDPGVSIYEFTGAMTEFGTPPPSEGPAFGDGDTDTDPVDLGTGLFLFTKTDLLVNDVVPIKLARTYRSRDSGSRAFGIGTSFLYDMKLWSENPYQDFDLILPDGGRIHYLRTSSGTGYTDATFEHTSTPSFFFKSTIRWNSQNDQGLGGWDLRLSNGVTLAFNSVSLLEAVRDRNGNTVQVVRPSAAPGLYDGHIDRIITPNGRWIAFTYDGAIRITSATDNTGRRVSYTYDTLGRLWKVTDAVGAVTEYVYDSQHRMTGIKDGYGRTYLTNDYDSSGRVSRQVQADQGVWLLNYVLAGTRVTQVDVTNPRGSVRRVRFDVTGYMISDTLALGSALAQGVVYERQAGSNYVLSVLDALNRRTRYQYTGNGRLSSITRLADTVDAVTTSFAYEPAFGLLSSVTDPLQHAMHFTYDGVGNLIAIRNDLNETRTFQHNPAGQPTAWFDQLNRRTNLTYQYGDLARIVDPLSRTQRRITDGVGRPVGYISPTGDVTRVDYNTMDWITAVTDPLGNLTRVTYDSVGNMTSLTDARDNTTLVQYDAKFRRIAQRDARQKWEYFAYDSLDHLTLHTDRRGKTTRATYDALNRLVELRFDNGATISYGYDLGNRLLSVSDSENGTITLTYDGLDRLLSESSSQGTVQYTYDAAGRRSSVAVSGGPLELYTYDSADRLVRVNRAGVEATFTYDARGLEVVDSLPNGISLTYSYNDAQELVSVTYRSGAVIIGTLNYSYDADGRRESIGGSWARSLLPGAVANASYNASNGLVTWGSETLTYDASSNLKSDGVNTYTWNARNQLASVVGPTSATFVYDGLGRRISKTEGGFTTNYVYAGWDVLREFTSLTSHTYLLGRGLDQRFARVDGGQTTTYGRDVMGGTVALLGTGGSLQVEYTYEPFGATQSTGAETDNPYEWQGREEDATGLYYFRNRYYSPRLQRFISQDPLGLAGPTNAFTFAYNSPCNFMDPLGLDAGPGSALPACYHHYLDEWFTQGRAVGYIYVLPPRNPFDWDNWIVHVGPYTLPSNGASAWTEAHVEGNMTIAETYLVSGWQPCTLDGLGTIVHEMVHAWQMQDSGKITFDDAWEEYKPTDKERQKGVHHPMQLDAERVRNHVLQDLSNKGVKDPCKC